MQKHSLRSTLAPSLLGLALLGLFLGPAGCGGGGAPGESAGGEPETAAVRGVTGDEIVLGCHTALSGPAAIWGVGSVDGMRMRFEEANEAGGVHGRKVRFIVEDHQYQVPRAIQAGNKLLNRDEIFAMIGALGTPMNNALLPEQMEKNVPNLFPYTASRAMIEPFHRLKWLGWTTYYDQTRAGLKYFVETQGKSAVCVQYQDSDFGQEHLDAVNDQLAALGLELKASASHKPTDTNFSAGLARLRQEGCDLVVLGTIIKDTILILSTARKMGWEVDFLGATASYSQLVASHESAAAEGFHAMTSFAWPYPETASPETVAWLERYRAEHDREPGLPSVMGYAWADLALQALEDAGRDLTVEGFTAALEAFRDRPAAIGDATFTFGPENHQGVNSFLLTKVESGRWQTLQRLSGY